jgi:hypothetical protein
VDGTNEDIRYWFWLFELSFWVSYLSVSNIVPCPVGFLPNVPFYKYFSLFNEKTFLPPIALTNATPEDTTQHS